VARTIAKDHSQKRRQILTTAAQVFAETGFDRTSMNQLSKACHISKANIYHYYDSKDAILYDLLETYLRGLQGRLALVDGKDLSPEDQLRELVKEVLMAYHGADNEHRVQATGIPLLPPEQQKVLRGYQRDMIEQMSNVVKNISPDKFKADQTDLFQTTMSIFGMLNWFYMWNRDETEEARLSYAKKVADIVLNGIRD